MMLHNKLRKSTLAALICLLIFSVMGFSVLAAEPHENPETATPVFSGISLLRYYADSLDFVLGKHPAEVEARLGKMPFASIPPSLAEATDSFAVSGTNISYRVVQIDADLGKLRALVGQSRRDEAIELAGLISDNLSQAYSELNQIEQATETTGKELKVSSAPAGSDLRRAYDEVVARINRIREMLDLYKSLLLASLLDFGAIGNIASAEEAAALVEQLAAVIEKLRGAGVSEELIQPLEAIIEALKQGGISAEEAAALVEQLAAVIEKLRGAGVSEELLGILAFGRPRPTAITLKIEPTVAFVGDNIRFEGVLTAEQRPLAGREVDILINGSPNITATTDADGRYQGVLPIPYWYIPELDLQVLYYPRDKDIGLYLASLSPVVKLKVLFYEARLAVTLEDKAYPGLTTMVSGRFDYGQSPSLEGRKVEIYLDDVFITEFVAQEVFAQKIRINPEANVGKHTITVSAAAAGRYAPVVTGAILNVTRATPILDLTLPGVALIPGSLRLEGKLYSEVGPLSEALIKMGLANSQVTLTSSGEGTFDTKIKVGMSLGMVGWQDLAIQVLPKEPWHTPLNTTSRVLVVNMLNIGGFLAVLVFLGIYLPRRLKRRLGAYPGRMVRTAPVTTPPEPAPATTPSEPAPASSHSVSVSATVAEREPDSGEPRSRIFNWYRLVVRFLLRIAPISLRPQQTLREFADEHRRVLGAGARYFNELTRMVERLLYSQYRPTEADVENSRQLSLRVEEESKLEVDRLPSGGEGRLADQFVRRAEEFEAGGRVLEPDQWRQASAWLWVLLIVAIAYFACLLLFLLPSLAAGYW